MGDKLRQQKHPEACLPRDIREGGAGAHDEARGPVSLPPGPKPRLQGGRGALPRECHCVLHSPQRGQDGEAGGQPTPGDTEEVAQDVHKEVFFRRHQERPNPTYPQGDPCPLGPFGGGGKDSPSPGAASTPRGIRWSPSPLGPGPAARNGAGKPTFLVVPSEWTVTSGAAQVPIQNKVGSTLGRGYKAIMKLRGDGRNMSPVSQGSRRV